MKKYSLHKGFIPKSIVLSEEHKGEKGEKRAILLLFITFLATFPLMKSEKEEIVEAEVPIKEEKNILHNHNNINNELGMLSINPSGFKSDNGNIEIEVLDVESLSKLEKLEKFKINTITESGNNKYKVSIRREWFV